MQKSGVLLSIVPKTETNPADRLHVSHQIALAFSCIIFLEPELSGS